MEKEKLFPIKYEELLYTHDPGLVAITKSILDSADIAYIFQGDSSGYVHPMIVPARLFVEKEKIQEARVLLKDFL